MGNFQGTIRGSSLAVRSSGQRHRQAIHFVYAGGEASPGPGTVLPKGPKDPIFRYLGFRIVVM